MTSTRWLAHAVLTSSPSAGRVAAALSQLPGSPFVDPSGSPRIRVTVSTRKLAELANLSKPSVVSALLELEEDEHLFRLGQRNRNAPASYSLPAHEVPAAPPHPAVDPEVHELVAQLEDLGVNGPLRVIGSFGFDAVAAAAVRLVELMETRDVRSPGGLLITLLNNGFRRRRLVPAAAPRKRSEDWDFSSPVYEVDPAELERTRLEAERILTANPALRPDWWRPGE